MCELTIDKKKIPDQPHTVNYPQIVCSLMSEADICLDFKEEKLKQSLSSSLLFMFNFFFISTMNICLNIWRTSSLEEDLLENVVHMRNEYNMLQAIVGLLQLCI